MSPYTIDTFSFRFELGVNRGEVKPSLDRIGFPDANQGRGGKDVVYCPIDPSRDHLTEAAPYRWCQIGGSMLSPKPVGRDASARKYDIITALGAHALSGDKHDHRLVLRLITLVTARENWARNELAVGQREIARLWSVDERTVKREMAKLRGCGWLIVKRQGARGRVTEYGLDLDVILDATRQHWPNVGPDFDLRMQGAPEPSRVVPLPVRGAVPLPVSDGSEWSLAQAVLHAEDAGAYGSWLHHLTRESRAGGRLTLHAPSRFHGAYVQTHLLGRVLMAVQAVDSDVSQIVITA